MGDTKYLEPPLATYGKAIRSAPRGVIFNHRLLISAAIYALSSFPGAWDLGAASVVSSLKGFQTHFGVTSGADASQIREIVSLVYVGQAIGAALCFFVNDRIGRLWSYRLYIAIWILGQLVAIFTPSRAGLYASRIICGIGIGAISVTGPMSIIEIAPAEIRGLLTSWFLVVIHQLQYQLLWLFPIIIMALCIAASFFVYESPKWLMIQDRHDEAIRTLVALRGLPEDHSRIQKEIGEIQKDIAKSRAGLHEGSSEFMSILKEMFTVKSNLRRLQQTLVSYFLSQMTGANSVTSYFIPIMTILNVDGGTKQSIFLSGMYGLSKLVFSLFATFFFIDTLGRRKSLFIGISLQTLSHLYLGVFIKYQKDGHVNQSASQGAIAAIFIHALGYAVGLLLLSYVFGGELWPNRIRSFGGCLSQTFHWIFLYAIKFSLPSMLSSMNDWGAFIFFTGWCFIALAYVFFVVPETSNMNTEEINAVFERPFFKAYQCFKKGNIVGGVGLGSTEGVKAVR